MNYLVGTSYTTLLNVNSEDEAGIPNFNPNHLIFCSSLTHLDISNCFEMDPERFVENVKSCQLLNYFILVNCTQFSEKHLTTMLSSLPNLRYIHGTGTEGISFCNALYIICSLLKLRAINLELKYIYFERSDWIRMMNRFPSIQFGHSISRMLPAK